MCWNAKTSLTTFIIGTAINLYVYLKFDSQNIKMLCIVWQWTLGMQLADYIIWKGIDDNNKQLNQSGTKMALFFNILQPLVVFIVILCFSSDTISVRNKVLASALIIFYMSFMLVKFNEMSSYTELKPATECTHLNLKWWKDISRSGMIYCITLFGIILLLYSPLKLALLLIGYLIVASLLSTFYSCGQPSMWCWFVVPLPLIMALTEKYTR